MKGVKKMALTQAFLCTPAVKEAKGLGNTITKYYTMTNDEANSLEDNYEAIESGEAWAIGIFLSLLGVAIKATVLAIGWALTTTTATSIGSDHFESLDNDIGEIADNGQSKTRIKCVYKYVRHGSNSGAYFLSEVEAV